LHDLAPEYIKDMISPYQSQRHLVMSTDIFRKDLKTYLFHQAFGI